MPLTAINREIRIQGQDRLAHAELDHANQTRIGQIHRHIGVSSSKLLDTSNLAVETKRNFDTAAAQDLENDLLTSPDFRHQVASLDDHRLASVQRWLDVGEGGPCPSVVAITLIEQRDQGTGVEQDAPFQRPRSSK